MHKKNILIASGGVAVLIGGYIFFQFAFHTSVQEVPQELESEVLQEALTQQVMVEDSVIIEDGAVIEKSQIQEIQRGTFNRIDAIHYAQGDAVIYQTDVGNVLKLENFKTNNAPDLFIYLSTEQPSTIKGDIGEVVSLGKLKSTDGDQLYHMPDDIEKYQSVIIWCRAFGIVFSAAHLTL